MQSVSKEHKGAEREHERARWGPWTSSEGAPEGHERAQESGAGAKVRSEL